jgi:hypothetical protein
MAVYILTPSQLYGQGILNSFIIPATGASVDPDAQAFITAAGITDPTQQSAINTLVIGMKANNVWTNMKAIYPFVGGTASTHKWNLKDPRDLDAAYRLQFFGGITHSSNGALPNGTNGYANTFLNPSIVLSNDSIHASTYFRTNFEGTRKEFGCSYVYGDGDSFYTLGEHKIQPTPGNTSYTNGGVSQGFITNPGITLAGNFIMSRTNNGSVNALKNNTASGSYSGASGNVNQDIYLMAANLVFTPDSISFYSELTGKQQIAFATIGQGLTNTESLNLANLIQSFQTALSRQV